jgi:uncharacterized protein (TIGR00730 family)
MEKAYKNLDFLTSRDARILRILSEYLEPQARFARYRIQDTVVFYGSARALPPDEADAVREKARSADDPEAIRQAEAAVALSRYYEDARLLARRMTAWSKSLPQPQRRFIVCSGGGPGIMEAANRGASEEAGISIGLGISLPEEPSGNRYITRELEFEFHYFFMRKFWFVYMAKALVVFPGGFGTLDELFELLTLVQTGKTAKQMPIVLYGSEYWKDVLDLNALVEWGTIGRESLDHVHVADSVDSAFDYLTTTLGRMYLNHENGREGGP